MARNEAIGFVETFGLAAAVACADAGVKGANVKLLGYEYTKGDGMCTVKFAGNVGAVKSAIEAGKRAADAVNGTLQGTKSVRLMARPAEGIKDIMIYNGENVGGEIALAKGVRPKATNRPPVLVKNWKPKEEPKEEAKAETPEPPVVEDLKEESVEDNTPVIAEEAPVEAVEETPEIPEVTAEKAEEIPAVEAEIVAPATEETPVVVEAEEPAKEEAPAPEPEKAPEAPEVKETPAPADDSKKKTSTGKKKSRKKKKSDE